MGVSLVSLEKVPMVLVDLTKTERFGEMKILVRLRKDDRDLINFAAETLGMTQADFLRTVLIGAAKKVISENAR